MNPYSNGTAFNTPPPEDFNTVAMQGSMQNILQDNLGAYVQIEFLFGTQGLVTRIGVLYAVGRGFVVLHDIGNQNYIVCDVYSIKFVTFFSPDGESGYVFPYYTQLEASGEAAPQPAVTTSAPAQPTAQQPAAPQPLRRPGTQRPIRR